MFANGVFLLTCEIGFLETVLSAKLCTKNKRDGSADGFRADRLKPIATWWHYQITNNPDEKCYYSLKTMLNS